MRGRYHHCPKYGTFFIKKNFAYSRTAVYFEKLNRMIERAVFLFSNRAVGQQTTGYKEFNTFNFPELNG